MRVVLLAAGRGSRLSPLTDTRPKCLLEVGGRPLLIRAVEILLGQGLTRFAIVDGYRGAMVRDALHDSFPHVSFQFIRNEEWAETGNAYSLHLSGPSEEPTLLLDSDIAFVPEVVERLLASSAPNRLALRSTGRWGEEEMKVRLGPDGRITALGKEIPPLEAAGESVGIELFSAPAVAALHRIVARRVATGPGRTEFYEAAFVELIRHGHPIEPVDLGDFPCVEIDTPEDLAAAEALFKVPA